MDIFAIIGVFFGIVCILVGQALEGGHIGSILQLTAAIIVIGGTLGAVILACPKNDLFKCVKITPLVLKPHKHDLEAYLGSSQRYVSGTVTLATDGGSVIAVAVETPYRLHKAGAVYAQSADWTPEEAVGFIKLLGQSTTLASKVRGSRE